ncbi:MAG TPA: hypothetical protein VLZ74_09770, partial [Methylocella sp.]|nr:hypothetical protein [Methylocella sp.]
VTRGSRKKETFFELPEAAHAIHIEENFEKKIGWTGEAVEPLASLQSISKLRPHGSDKSFGHRLSTRSFVRFCEPIGQKCFT